MSVSSSHDLSISNMWKPEKDVAICSSHGVELDTCLFSKMLLAITGVKSTVWKAASEKSNFTWLFLPSTTKDDKCIVSVICYLQKCLRRWIPTQKWMHWDFHGSFGARSEILINYTYVLFTVVGHNGDKYALFWETSSVTETTVAMSWLLDHMPSVMSH